MSKQKSYTKEFKFRVAIAVENSEAK